MLRPTILFIPLDFQTWQNASHQPYSCCLGFEEGFDAAGADYFTIPSYQESPSLEKSSWLSRIHELCKGMKFDQVWIEIVHSRYDDDFLEWITAIAPVRIGIMGESMETDPQEHPAGVKRRRENIEHSLSAMTHLLLVDEVDVDRVNSEGKLPAKWVWDAGLVPKRFIGEAYQEPSIQSALFFGALYGVRKQWLMSTQLKDLIFRPDFSLEHNTRIPEIYDALNKNCVHILGLDGPLPSGFYDTYINSMRTLRRKAFSLWIDTLSQGLAVVNLPQFGKAPASRVSEGIASVKPMINWSLPERPRTNSLFEEGTEILLYARDNPDQLAEHIKRLQKDRKFGARLALAAAKKMKAHHTIEDLVRQVLEWTGALTVRASTQLPKAHTTILETGPAQKVFESIADESDLVRLGAISAQCTTDARMMRPHDDVLQRLSTNKLWSAGRPLRLHLGCGEQHLDGYVNIDYPPSEHNVMNVTADLFANITELDFSPHSVDEIRLHHVFEHFNRVTALALLIRWHTWLKIGGRLHIETPDLLGSAKTLISDSSWKTKAGVVRHIAGDQSAAWAYHIDHWFPERFERTLDKLGYTGVETTQSSWPCEPYLSNVTLFAIKSRDISSSEHLTAADEILWESTVADSEKPTFEIWRKQLRSVLDGQILPAPANIELPDISTITQAQSILVKRPTSLPLSEIHNFNQNNRDKWVQSKAVNIPAGSRVLDIGAGTCPYRSLFFHCDYKAHDFKQYTGVKLGGTSDYGAIDYESDINHIPVPDSSFDVILCTEVLEHATEPIEALREMSRILKPGGRLLLTAPLGSGLHQLPYHYYGGFTPDWYKLFCERFGLAIKEIVPNGGFFKLLAQECARVSWTMPNHKHLHENSETINHLFGDWLPRYLFSLEDKCFIDQFTVGYHVEAIKQVSKFSNAARNAAEKTSENADVSSSHLIRNTNQYKAVGIIFSKDRAMQLDCTLRSLMHHCKDISTIATKVLYTTSNAQHENQYQKIKADYPSVEFIREKDFKSDLLAQLTLPENILFLVDDNVFVSDFFLGYAIDELKNNSDCLGFSLRLGKNTDYCYMLKKQQAIPKIKTRAHNICRYEWVTAECDFGYPLEVSSSLYKTADIVPLLNQLDYKNPNTLELALDTNKTFFQVNMKFLLCFEKSVTFCNPINMVQTQWKNRTGENSSYSLERLAELYDEGYRIDVEHFSGFTPNSCHQEVALKFVKTGSPINEHVKPYPLLSILILNYNGFKHLQPCLDSIKRNTPESHEIIIIDNYSTDGSRDYLRSRQDITLVENTKNLGCPPARAQLLSLARGKFVIFLDNDTIVTKDWARKFLNYAESDPKIGMIGPRSNYVSGAQLIPNIKYTNVDEMERFAEEWAASNKGSLMPTIRLVGFCMFITRELINKIGNIDATFGRFGFEDDDYTWRANIAGFKTIIANDVFIHHTGGPQGQGDSLYNQLLFDAWEVVKRKWKLPKDIKYGQQFDLKAVLGRPFDNKQHYIPLMEPCAIENLVYKKSLPQENMLPLETGKTVNAENPLYPQFTQEIAIDGMTSIIIPVQSIHLEKCVASIKKYTQEPHEIIFLDHGAAPKLKKQIVKAIKENRNYKVVKIDRKVKFTQSLNMVINQSTGEYIVLLFDDVFVGEGWHADMLECLHSGKKIGIVGAMSGDATGLQRVEGVDFNSPEKRLSFRERNRHRRIYTRNLDGFCLLFRRDLLIRIGLFDEIFGEKKHVFDDFCVRAVLDGYNNVIVGSVFVHNLGGINRLLSGDKTLFDDKWIGLEAVTPLAEKVLIANSIELARSQYHKGLIVDAVQTLIARIGYSPNERRLFYQIAEILLAENKFQEALDALKGMVPAEDDAEYYALLGYGNEGLSLYKVAEEFADKALAIDGKFAPVLNLKGILAYKKDELNNAEEFFRQAIEADPGFGEPYTNTGMLRWKADQKEEAVDLFEKGFILSPDKGDLVTAYYNAISSLELYTRAENIFLEARATYPENKRVLFLLIDIFLKQDKFHEAMMEVEKAMVQFGMDTGILSAALEIRKKIGAKTITVMDGKATVAPTLSICMIVKNEEQHLAYCLNSLSPVADEMIVVDTGSTDKTKEIAVAFGARVFDIEWTNDFAVARNHSLSKAQGDWILVMDADEVISFQDHAKLKKLISRKDKVAYNIITRNYVNKTAGDGWVCNDDGYLHEQAGRGWFPSGKVRLFPNNEKIRFENPIHELVEYSIQRIGMDIQESGIPVHHYGELNIKKATEKDVQYYELGVQKMKESGGDFKSVWELAVQAGELGKSEEAIELWHKVLEFKQRESTAYFNMANHYLHLGKHEDSYDCSRKAYALDPNDQSSVFSYAMSEFLAGDINKTISTLEIFLKGTDTNVSLVGLLAVSYILAGEKDRGLKYLRGMVKKKYNCVFYFKDLAQSLIAAGNLTRAKYLLTAAIEIKFYDQETSALLAKCEDDDGKRLKENKR